jgi:filamentous hemagglutinin family protein
VQSNPVNPVVVNGTATFNQAGKVLTVTNSPGAIINWDKFSIKAGETTHFAQTAASSTVLNRVLNDPTAIYGTLSSNGKVWLVNPAGIMVGPGGRSTPPASSPARSTSATPTSSPVASCSTTRCRQRRQPGRNPHPRRRQRLSDRQQRRQRKHHQHPARRNHPRRRRHRQPGRQRHPGRQGRHHRGGRQCHQPRQITAEAGRIGIAGVIVRNSGTVNASSVVSEGGRIFLKASQDAYVDGNGRIVTTGTRGGSVEVLGNRVAVMDKAEIDASGTGEADGGGGRILVGGDYQGKNPDVQNANVSYFGPDATLKADAGKVGDGGTVIIWSDDTTRAYGRSPHAAERLVATAASSRLPGITAWMRAAFA